MPNPKDLNAAQWQAVMTTSGPLLVLAGAGTGKTRVVTFRIAELIRRGIRPERILAVTFTNKAAGEMRSRACEMIGKRLDEKPEISTFHSLCVRILRRHAKALGYPAGFAIYDRGDQESVARTVLREIKVAEGALRPGDLLYWISRWKTASLGPEQAAAAAESDKQHLAASGFRRYQKALKTAGAMDFDDLLLQTEELFAHFRRSAAAKPSGSTTSWSTNIKTPTPTSTASSRPWPAATATSASWGTTTSRSMGGGGPRWPTSSASPAIGPTPKWCVWR